jgi:hypothetical protein
MKPAKSFPGAMMTWQRVDMFAERPAVPAAGFSLAKN